MRSVCSSLLLTAAVLSPSLLRAEMRALTYERDIRPILKHHCFHCHGEGEKLKGGLDVRLRRFLVEPHNKDGAVAIVPGKPEESELLTLVKEGEMPQKAKPLSAKEIATLESWIAQGAKTARPEPAEVPAIWVSEEDRAWWAFQPLKRPAVPGTAQQSKSSPIKANQGSPIDAFLLAELAKKDLSFNPEADKATLLRRVMLDLTGLPPTPEETELFLADDAPGAYERLIDRTLASPHYGERWGRHWLDVAGYSDSDGYDDKDTARPWAFKYRDYVIRSLNADKPFDEFIREQIAGDEMVKQPFKGLSPADTDKLTATAFLRMVPDGTAGAPAADQPTARNAVMAETIKVVSSSLLGITVGCAQCHEHKHDPVPQQDYYRMRAIFEPALDVQKWRVPAARLVSLMTDEERAKAAEVEKEAKVVDAERKAKEDEYIEKVLTWELEPKPAELREPLRTAYRTEVKKRTPEQLKLLKEHPTINQLSPGSLYLYDRTYKTTHEKDLKVFAEKAAEIRKRKPVEQFIPVLSEVPAAPLPETRLFLRGMIEVPREKMTPGELTVLAALRPSPIPEKSPNLPTSGRRLAFAQSLTDGTHPLTTRVLVNRVWYHHFGKGIVTSLSDFGHLGDKPSHPELLDWLATEFVAKGWSLKSLHRTILLSAAYRQSSTRDAKKEQLDPDNRLLGRMNSRRLEAETIRDAMLRVTGKFNPKMLGAPVPVMLDESGLVVIGVNTNDTAGRPSGKFVALNGDEFRRSLYIQMRRSQPLGMLETFDMPRMEPNCEIRNASTVAPQSLAMMNSNFTLAQSKYFAERVTRDAGPDVAAQVKRAWQLAFGLAPTDAEVKDATAFITKQTATLKAHPVALPKPRPGEEPPPTDPTMQALATFCQALLTSNQFLYVD